MLEIHSETRDMFSTLVPSGGEMPKEPLYVFTVCIQFMYSVYVFSVCIQCMYSVYVFSVCIQCMYSVYVFSVCIQCMYSVYVFSVCIQCMYLVYVFSVCIQCMYSVYVFSVCIQCMYSVYVFSVCIQCMYSVYVFSVCIQCMKGNTHHSCHFWKGNKANSSVSNTVHYILLQFLQSVYFFYLKYKGQNCTVTLHIFRICAKNERWYSVLYTVLRSCETQMQNELVITIQVVEQQGTGMT